MVSTIEAGDQHGTGVRYALATIATEVHPPGMCSERNPSCISISNNHNHLFASFQCVAFRSVFSHFFLLMVAFVLIQRLPYATSDHCKYANGKRSASRDVPILAHFLRITKKTRFFLDHAFQIFEFFPRIPVLAGTFRALLWWPLQHAKSKRESAKNL